MREEVVKLIKQFTGHENIIAVPRILIDLTGDQVLAMMLNQLLYWSDKKEWVYKSLEDWCAEIGHISRRTMNEFAELPYIETEVRKADGAPTTHYRIDDDNFYQALSKLIFSQNEDDESLESDESVKWIYPNEQMDLPKCANGNAQMSKSLTEITTDITSDNIVVVVAENSDFAEIAKVYQAEIGILTPFVKEDIEDALEHYPRDWIIEAIKLAAFQNVRKWKYAEGILKNWKVNGFNINVHSKQKQVAPQKKSLLSPELQAMLDEEKAERERLYGSN
jgi:DnaD/phage-associated family protein